MTESSRTPGGPNSNANRLAVLVLDNIRGHTSWEGEARRIAAEISISESMKECATCNHTRDRHVGCDKHEECCDEEGCGCAVFSDGVIGHTADGTEVRGL